MTPLNNVNINDQDNINLIETDTLNALFSMAKGENSIRILIDVYLRDAQNNIEQIISSLNNSEFHQIADIAHALDGSSRSIGAKRLSIVASKVFKLAQSEIKAQSKNILMI